MSGVGWQRFSGGDRSVARMSEESLELCASFAVHNGSRLIARRIVGGLVMGGLRGLTEQ